MSNTALEKRQSANESKSNIVNVPDRSAQSAEQHTTYYTPLVDIAETNDAFIFQADLPGVKAGDVDVSFENGVLTIAAKAHPRQPQGHRYVWNEFGVGHFYRQFTLNTPINVDGLKAELKNGVLRLHIQKAEHAKPRKIEISG